tara:strand:+ start:26 stop:1573 length:1548 start_codon:yes stop_codon:yes gene_type:complete
MNLIDKILEEWSYRVNDGMPNPKNPLHLVHLQETLNELRLPKKVSEKLLQNLRQIKEDDIVKNKDSGNTYAVQQHNPDTQDLVKKDASKDDIENIKKDKEEPKKDTNTSDKITPKQIKKEKNKKEYLNKIADLFIGANSEEKGHGRFRLSKEDVKQYQEHLAKSTEQLLKEQKNREQEREKKYGKITPEDTEDVLEIIKSKVDSKQWNSLKSRIKKKGDPPGEYSKGERGAERVNLVIQHYLMTGGVSSITGKSVPFSDSQLDHVISLDNGGVDGPENWEWMESRFNQFKGKRTEPEVIKALKEKGIRTDAEWLLEASEDELKNFEGESAAAYWNTIFANTDDDGNHGLGNLTIEKIDNMKSSELNDLAKGWGRFVSERDPRFIPRYGTRKTEIDGKRLPYSRGGDVKPDKNNPNSWGVSTDNMGLTWSEPTLKDDADGYEKALAIYEKSRASGGAKITTPEVREMIKVKITNIPSKSESDEIDVIFEAILGQVEADKLKIKDLKQQIKQQKVEK